MRDLPNPSQAYWCTAGSLISAPRTRAPGGRAARVAASSLDPNLEIGGLPHGDAACVRVSRGG